MATFHKVLQLQFVLLVVACFLRNAHSLYVDHDDKLQVGPVITDKSSNDPRDEHFSNDTSIDSIDVTLTNSLADLQIETSPVPETVNEHDNSTLINADNSSRTDQFTNAEHFESSTTEEPNDFEFDEVNVNNSSTTEDEESSVSTTPIPDDTNFDIETIESEEDFNTTEVYASSVREKEQTSTSNPNSDDTVLQVGTSKPENDFSLPEVNTSSVNDISISKPTPIIKAINLQVERSKPEEDLDEIKLNTILTNYESVSTSTLNIETTTLQIGTSEPKNNLNMIEVNNSSANDVSVSTPTPNFESTTLQMGTSKPENDLSITEVNTSFANDVSISTPTPNVESTTLQIGTSKPENDLSITEVNTSSANDVSISTPTPNFETATLQMGTSKPENNLNVIEVNTSSVNDISISTPVPNFETTTLRMGTSEPKDDLNTTKVNTSSANDVSISTPNPKIETTTVQVTLKSNADEEFKVTSINNALPYTKSANILKIPPKPRSKDLKVDDPNNKSNITPAIVDADSKTNQTSVIDNSTTSQDNNGSSTTEKSSETRSTRCLSIVRTTLIDSFSKIVIDVLNQLVGIFINALDETFREVYDQSMPSFLKQVEFFLDTLVVEVDDDVNDQMNYTFADILNEKSLTFSIINDAKQNITGSSRNVTIHELNDTIAEIFKEIEQPLTVLSLSESHNSTLLVEAVNNISILVNSTVNEFLHGVNEVTIDEVANSSIARNASKDMTKLVEDHLDNIRLDFEQFSNDSESFTKLTGDLIKITVQYKNNFVKDIDSLLVDSLIGVNDKKQLLNTLLERIFVVLQHLRRNLLKSKINRASGTRIVEDPNQFEQSSLLKIENTLNLAFAKDMQAQFLSNLSHSINDSIRIMQLLFNDLINLSENRSSGSVVSIYRLIENSLYYTLFGLQKEVPPLLDFHFINSSSSLNIAALNETYASILRDQFNQLNLCESGMDNDQSDKHIVVDSSTSRPNFSTSAGMFVYPFEYLLIGTLLGSYVVMW